MNRRSAALWIGLLAPLSVAAPALAQQPAATLPAANAVLYESPDQLRALAAAGPTILYFHATWCPTCQATMTSFQARWPEVRPGLTLVIVDYDTETDLKSEYGVTYQNTYVQIAADLSRVQIWNGGGIEALNSRTQF